MKGFTLSLQETLSIHEFMNIPKTEFIAYIYILYLYKVSAKQNGSILWWENINFLSK